VTARSATPDRTVAAVFLATIALGGSNGVAIRIGLGELPPIWSATLRFGLATLILVALAALVRPPLPRGRALIGAILYGLLGFAATYAFAYIGLVNGGAGVAQLVIALAPLLTMLLAVGLGMESFRWQGLAGSVLAAGGIAVVFGDQLSAEVPLASLLLFLGGAVAIAATSVVAKRIPPGHPIPANAIGMAIGTLVLAPLSLALGERWAVPVLRETWISLLYLASVGSVALFLAFPLRPRPLDRVGHVVCPAPHAALDRRRGGRRSRRADHAGVHPGRCHGPLRHLCGRLPHAAAREGSRLPAAGGGLDSGRNRAPAGVRLAASRPSSRSPPASGAGRPVGLWTLPDPGGTVLPVTAADPQAMFCYRHPARETFVRCGRCDQPICTGCAMQGPVGLRCRQCGTPPRDPLTAFAPAELGVGAAAAVGAGTLAGLVGLQIGFLFSLCIGPVIGGLIGEAVLRATGYKRGPIMRLLVVGGIVGGVLLAGLIQYAVLFRQVGEGPYLGLDAYLASASLGASVYILAALFGAFARVR
jgi:drug/metabolite transporter (DMT)-like permease